MVQHMTCIKVYLSGHWRGTSENFPPQVRRMRRSRWRGCLGRGGDFEGKTSDINGMYYHASTEDMLELTRRMTIARNCLTV